MKSYLKIFLLNRSKLIINLVSISVISIYFWKNHSNDALGFLVLGNAKFLVFTNIYYLNMMFRYRVYESVSLCSRIRVGEAGFKAEILKYEILIYVLFFFVIYIAGMMVLGTEYLYQYGVMITIYFLILSLTQCVHFLFFLYNRNMSIAFITTYIVLAFYNYFLFGIIYAAIC